MHLNRPKTRLNGVLKHMYATAVQFSKLGFIMNYLK